MMLLAVELQEQALEYKGTGTQSDRGLTRYNRIESRMP